TPATRIPAQSRFMMKETIVMLRLFPTKARRASVRAMKNIWPGLAAAALLACGASIDPAAKADIDSRLGALQPSDRAPGPPTGFEPRPFAVGQWTLHKMTDQDGHPGPLTYK